MSNEYRECEFSDLAGKRILKIDGLTEQYSDTVTFTTAEGIYKMFHEQDCCESVTVEDVVGDIKDIMFEPILSAEEVTEQGKVDEYDSYTWTFYKIDTAKGGITIRWYGSSNGYYSESVYLMKKEFL